MAMAVSGLHMKLISLRESVKSLKSPCNLPKSCHTNFQEVFRSQFFLPLILQGRDVASFPEDYAYTSFRVALLAIYSYNKIKYVEFILNSWKITSDYARPRGHMTPATCSGLRELKFLAGL